MDYRSREKLVDVREERRGATRLEVREDKDKGTIILEGYAATHDPYDVHGGPDAGGWVEELSQRAFDSTLQSNPDVQLLINHEGTPLARTKSGTLKLTHDKHGLRVMAFLDPTDPDVQRLVPKMRRGDMDEMSFAFRVKDQTWDSSYSYRTITSLSLEKGDVSVVNYGMNPGTRAILSAEAVGTLAQLSSADVAELRKLDGGQIQKAQVALAKAVEMRKNEMRKGNKEPYGNVPYADPGYKPDGKKRYPIDTADHARAAWSYINMDKNHKGYTSEQVSNIKSRIRNALKKFGVEVGGEQTSLSHIDTQHNAAGGTTLVAVMTDGSRVPLPSQQALRELPAPPAHPDSPYAILGQFTPMQPHWNPSVYPSDPHNDSYDMGMMGDMSGGPLASNIEGGPIHYLIDVPFDPALSPSDPHDVPFNVDGAMPQFHPAHPGWNPSDAPSGDPHDTPMTIGGKGSPDTGPVAPNIVTGGKVGQYSEGYGWNPGDSPGDPHSRPYDETVGRSANSEDFSAPGYNSNRPAFAPAAYGWNPGAAPGDPHDTPYSTGNENLTPGPVADNIVTGGNIGAHDAGFGWNPSDPHNDPHADPMAEVVGRQAEPNDGYPGYPQTQGGFHPVKPQFSPAGPMGDPHDCDYTMGDMVPPNTGAVAPNIITGGVVGAHSTSGYGWNPSDGPMGDPHDCDVTPSVTSMFSPEQPGWNANPANVDPHQMPNAFGEGGTVGQGPVAGNIMGSGQWHGMPVWPQQVVGPQGDPHNMPYGAPPPEPDGDNYYAGTLQGSRAYYPDSLRTQWAPDPHDAQYDMGPYQSGPVNAPNIIGGKVRPAYGPGYGRVPANPVIGMPGSGLNRPVAGSNPAYKRGISISPGQGQPAGYVHGHQVGNHGSPMTGWQPTNIWTGGPGAPGGTAPMQGDATEWEENPSAQSIDLNIAAALDRTITHAYSLSSSVDVRKLLAYARYQASCLRGAPRQQQRSNDISRRLSELRKEVGMPDTGTVSDGLKYLRSAGSAPVGYGGVLSPDPDCHVTTPSERLARKAAEEAKEKRSKATEAEVESQRAEDRLKRARREAELNAVIARRSKKDL